jgi:hypothetical protein
MVFPIVKYLAAIETSGICMKDFLELKVTDLSEFFEFVDEIKSTVRE